MEQRGRNAGAATAFVVLGAAAIIFAGLFSAVTARSASYHSAWLVAYLVLIVGISQVVLGLGNWWLAATPLRPGSAVGVLLLFNLGNAGVIVGTLVGATIWVDVGSALLVIALLGFGWATRSPRRSGLLWAYWAFVAMLLISVVVGLVFAHTGAR